MKRTIQVTEQDIRAAVAGYSGPVLAGYPGLALALAITRSAALSQTSVIVSGVVVRFFNTIDPSAPVHVLVLPPAAASFSRKLEAGVIGCVDPFSFELDIPEGVC